MYILRVQTHSIASRAKASQDCAVVKVHGLPGNSALIYSWLPLGPPAYALLACQVAAMLRSTLEDAQKLRHQMYNLKSV